MSEVYFVGRNQYKDFAETGSLIKVGAFFTSNISWTLPFGY